MFESNTNRQTRKQAMDGFTPAPQRSRPQPTGRHSGLTIDRFRHSGGAGRRVGDFKRADGYHPAPQAPVTGQTSVAAAKPSKSAESQASILNMTLPGGFGDPKRRSQPANKQAKGRWRSVRRWGLRSGLVFGALVLVGGGFFGLKLYNKLHKIFQGGGTAAALQGEVTPELLKGEGDGRVNILLLGRGGDQHDGPDLTDTILVASVDPLNKNTHLVSIPRDLWVTSGGSSSKINAVFANAKNKALAQDSKDKKKAEKVGMEAVEQAVSQVLGIPLHYYGIVDFDAFKGAVDTVGGVTVNVPQDLVDYTMAWENKGNPVLAKQGQQAFDGYHALMYVRSRHGSARGDFDRTERQRLFIQALTQKILSANTYSNPVKVSQLMDNFGDHVATDFSLTDMLRLMSIMNGADMSKLASIGLADPPNPFVRTDMIANQSVVVPTAGVADYSQIQAFIRKTLRDPYILKENARVALLNGTTVAGLAADKGEQLQSYGYNITEVGDAPTKAYQKTVIVDLSGGSKPYTKNYLEKRFGVKVTDKLPDGVQAKSAEFVVILGQDE